MILYRFEDNAGGAPRGEHTAKTSDVTNPLSNMFGEHLVHRTPRHERGIRMPSDSPSFRLEPV